MAIRWKHFKKRGKIRAPKGKEFLEKVLKEFPVEGRIALLQTKSDQDSELYNFEIDSTTQLHFLRNTTPFIIRCFSASNQNSFTVSYLINSCGLSPETAISASEKIRFENPKNPDSVLALLRDAGCTNTHITKIVTKLPSLLLVNPEKALLPKLEFFRSMGLSSADLASILSSEPSILNKSLEKVLIPKHNFLKSVHVNNEGAMKILKRSSWSSSGNTIAANIAVLREIGVPISHVSFLVVRYHTICQKSDKFSENVKKVVEMGFNPLKFTFVNALQAFCQMTESTRQQKMEMYRGWGWSEDEIVSAFRSRPQCMQLSEKKVTKVLDFLVNKMGWQPAVVARAPVAICLNFEKRVVPRCSVVKVLLLKGLVKKDLRLDHFLSLTEENFLDKYVIKYRDDIPQLLDLYQGKVSFMELGFGS
ncbi:transcription termination factor MTERF15, mitochondrial-like [Vitis riparia]|uniref:transcription termination factor MTERF15, mitochondrial-like n=1 Tax=Vitis riparia TaxID=96939 RepID=UPI00155A27BA|nr:transcription termination factor MTERF15, mitochondrial-like [Vitis riparia]